MLVNIAIFFAIAGFPIALESRDPDLGRAPRRGAGGNFEQHANTFLSIFILILFVPTLSATVRRLHDTDHSGWWIFIRMVPCVGDLILLAILCGEGTRGRNPYGPDPKMSAFDLALAMDDDDSWPTPAPAQSTDITARPAGRRRAPKCRVCGFLLLGKEQSGDICTLCEKQI